MASRPTLLFLLLAFSNQTGATLWDGGKIVDGKCFVFVKYPKVTWNEAQSACANMGGALATVSSLSQISKFESEFSIGGEVYWIGLNDKAVEGQFAWDETKSPATEITSDWWALNFPTTYNSDLQDCGGVTNGHIFDSYGTLNLMYLCIEPNSSTTKCTAPTTPPATVIQPETTTAISTIGNTKWDGAKIVDGKCFVFVKYPKVTWNEAQSACANMGGALATVSSLSQISKFESEFSIGGEVYWIGLNDKAVEGQFAWDETKSPATEITSDWWALNFPTTYNSDLQDCGGVTNGHIFDSYGTLKLMYLCIEPNSSTTKCTAPTTPLATTLPATTPPSTTLPTTTQPSTTLQATTTVPTRTSASTTQATTTDSSAVTVTSNVLHFTLSITLTAVYFYTMS
ncbi:C-type mannose receptor 2-like [Physella acuta]|uniref:C-type mannose receptor 2-like n=1 Tax=Physella acuta TaxID=109671 RepID=UPI0027DE8296|nr:C-type mannose receptor 2-like [Physella acuta]